MNFLLSVVYTFVAMLLLGVAHGLDPRVPTLGFVTLYVIGTAISYLRAGFTVANND